MLRFGKYYPINLDTKIIITFNICIQFIYRPLMLTTSNYNILL